MSTDGPNYECKLLPKHCMIPEYVYTGMAKGKGHFDMKKCTSPTCKLELCRQTPTKQINRL